ncbi:hypothetical protein VCHA48P437_280011 [Vibrio chagasii]|nr:hypothetical protein VCHA48P437_280011 [Vibrio chagasii]CAH7376531.1 hypothetical protein VCHA55O508_290011 [Vibrio chagasii]
MPTYRKNDIFKTLDTTPESKVERYNITTEKNIIAQNCEYAPFILEISI